MHSLFGTARGSKRGHFDPKLDTLPLLHSLPRQGTTSLFHALGSCSASVPSHSPVQQLGTVYLTLYEAHFQKTT